MRVPTPPSLPVDPRPVAVGEGERGVVLLHGLTGTPYEVKSMAQALAGQGFAVRAPLLAGHTDLGALERVTWRDWYTSAAESFDGLLDGGRRRVIVLGFSMGSLLALRLAALRPDVVAGVVAISVPLSLDPWKRTAIATLARLRTSPLLGSMVGMLPKRSGPDVRIQRELQNSPSLRGFPYPALAELVALQDEVADLLPHVRAPLLLVHGRLDHTTPPEQSTRVAQRVGSSRVELEILPRSFHIVGLDLDRDRACERITRFAVSVLGDPGDSSKETA
jgi:carboxylesterase